MRKKWNQTTTPRLGAGNSPHPGLSFTPRSVPAPPKTRMFISEVPCASPCPTHPMPFCAAFSEARTIIKTP